MVCKENRGLTIFSTYNEKQRLGPMSHSFTAAVICSKQNGGLWHQMQHQEGWLSSSVKVPESRPFPSPSPIPLQENQWFLSCWNRTSHLNPHCIIKYVSCIHTDLPNVLLDFVCIFSVKIYLNPILPISTKAPPLKIVSVGLSLSVFDFAHTVSWGMKPQKFRVVAASWGPTMCTVTYTVASYVMWNPSWLLKHLTVAKWFLIPLIYQCSSNRGDTETHSVIIPRFLLIALPSWIFTPMQNAVSWHWSQLWKELR